MLIAGLLAGMALTMPGAMSGGEPHGGGTTAAPEAPAPGPQDDRQMHGMVEAGIGTGGYRSYGAAVSLPVGENGRLDLAYREGRNQPWGYGYGGGYRLRRPGFYSPYGGWSGRGYGAASTSKSLSMGFSWSKDKDADERDSWRRGLSAY